MVKEKVWRTLNESLSLSLRPKHCYLIERSDIFLTAIKRHPPSTNSDKVTEMLTGVDGVERGVSLVVVAIVVGWRELLVLKH